jgi:hypothetical protein
MDDPDQEPDGDGDAPSSAFLGWPHGIMPRQTMATENFTDTEGCTPRRMYRPTTPESYLESCCTSSTTNRTTANGRESSIVELLKQSADSLRPPWVKAPSVTPLDTGERNVVWIPCLISWTVVGLASVYKLGKIYRQWYLIDKEGESDRAVTLLGTTPVNVLD